MESCLGLVGNRQTMERRHLCVMFVLAAVSLVPLARAQMLYALQGEQRNVTAVQLWYNGYWAHVRTCS